MIGGFLLTQADYICFIYGLALVLLSAVCITIRHDDPRGLSWAILGLFGFIHGVYEWMEMLSLSLGDSPIFASVRLCVLALSYVVLFEFARTGWRRLQGTGPGCWVYAPFLLIALSGALAGESGLHVTVQYALAWPSATCAALTLVRAARIDRTSGAGLMLGATALLGYAIAAGLVVPPAHFFPASTLNTNVFFDYTGLPLQMVRAILAVLIAASLWAYHLQRRRRALDLEEWPVPYHGWQMAFFLCVVLVIGWRVTQTVGGHTDRDLLENMEDHAEVAAAVADVEAVKAVVQAPESTHAAARRLRLQFRKMLEASPHFRWVHLLILRPTHEIQAILSVPDLRHALAEPIPRIYLRPPQEIYAAFSGNPAVGAGTSEVLAVPYEEDGHRFISGFAPVRDLATGEILAVLALDLDASRWHQSVGKSRLLAIAVTLLISVLLLGFFVVQQRQMQTTERIALSESRLTEAQGIAHIGSWTYNPKDGRMTWSPELFRILGCNPQTVEPSLTAIQQTLTREDRLRLDAVLQKDAADDHSHELEVHCSLPEGLVRCLLWRVRPKRDPRGAVVRWVGTVQDITDRKRTEEEIRRLNVNLERSVQERTAQLADAYAQLESFSYSVSHDLRAPVRHMIGFLDLFKKTLPAGFEPRAMAYLENMGTASSRMAALIDDLLVFSKVSRAEMHQDRVDLQRLVQDVLRELEPDIAGRRVVWKIDELPEVVGDVAMLHQVIANLLENALKFSRTREPAVIEIGSCRDTTRDIVFVRDNGVGFDPTYAGKLFGVFQRLHTQAQFTGSGVGLATVRQIIQRHGGQIWAESAENKGATFYFTLPRT